MTGAGDIANNKGKVTFVFVKKEQSWMRWWVPD